MIADCDRNPRSEIKVPLHKHQESEDEKRHRTEAEMKRKVSWWTAKVDRLLPGDSVVSYS
jgi:hypothetical protein